MGRRNILFYGGAFDPPHLGHIRYFREAVRAVQPDLSLIVPSQVSPHKQASRTPFALRAAMCRVFLTESGRVVISGIENTKNRKKSYSVKTLKRLRRRYPDAEIHMMIGSDMLLSFKSWYHWRRILSLCTLVVAVRDDADLAEAEASAEDLVSLGGKILWVRFEPLETSSSEIRRKLAEGDDYEGLLDPGTVRFIRAHGLYGVKR